MKHPAEISPSDQLLSRCYREMEKRFLTVYDMWKVKTLLHQVMTTKKRKQVGTDLFTFEDDTEAMPETHGCVQYLALLYTYLLALSIAGSTTVEGAPKEEAFGNDSTKFVKVPWDVLQAYYFRAARAAMLVPEASRLPWLQERDISERAAWVSQFREGDEPLGQVILSVMEKRGAHWDAPIQNTQSRPGPSFQPHQISKHYEPKTPTRNNHDQQKGHQKTQPQKNRDQRQSPGKGYGKNSESPKKMAPGSISEALRDGKTLCPDFNKGRCSTKGASCSKGLHKCAKVSHSGRPCGMANHGAHNCRKS